MFRSLHSLRFKLPAIFLAGVVLTGLISTAIAVRLFQQYTNHRATQALTREARGMAQLYADLSERLSGNRAFSGKTLELATGDRVYFMPRAPGVSGFNGVASQPFNQLKPGTVDLDRLERSGTLTLTIDPPGRIGPLLAVAAPVKFGSSVIGAMMVGTPRSALRSGWLTLIDRLALAFAGGVAVAGALGWYLSRRITRPVLALSRAADEIALGRYDVELPPVTSADEIGHLSARFREMAARLGEAEELERHFLMTVSHELRTPLTAIRGHVSALSEGLVDDPELQQQSLEIVQSETERLERLVGDVLDLAKLHAHRFTVLREEVDMDALVDRAYTAYAEEARRRGIDYERSGDGGPVIETDGDRVLQIISNLLANAFRWTPDGGRIEVALAAANGAVEVAVADTGPGIPPVERERIFRPFWSRDDAGTGLGLAIANELSVALGGRIDLDSRAGIGSRFALVLPVPESYPASAVGRRSSIR